VGQKVATYGKHAQYVVVRAENARSIHRDVADEHAVFFTIAEIVMNGIRRGYVQWGESAVVSGVGILGQLAVQFLRLCGARPVIAVDIADSRLARLPQDTAVVCVNAAREDVARVVQNVTKGRKADVVFEVTGNKDVLPDQIRLLRDQGRLVILGCPRGATQFDFHDLCNWPSISIIGAHNMSHPRHATPQNPWTNHRHAEMFFDLVADGEVQIEPLISHRVRWSEAPKVYEMLISDRSQAMGVVLDWTD
jgi:threonine dehydrogenase-like Zn-dependent dehydrogenase